MNVFILCLQLCKTEIEKQSLMTIINSDQYIDNINRDMLYDKDLEGVTILSINEITSTLHNNPATSIIL